MPEIEIEIEKDEHQIAAERAALDASLAEAKVRFSKPLKLDLATTPPLAPAVSEQARELQQLKAQLHDAERTAMRAQKAASDYREQLTEAQADIAAMKNRWYAAEKARNAVSSQREVDSSTINTQLLRAQKELERTQQLARSDMERAASRIQVLEGRLEKALTSVAQAESAQLQQRKRSNVFLSSGIALAIVVAGIALYRFMPHPNLTDGSLEAPGVASSRSGAPGGATRRIAPVVPLEALSQRPFVSKKVTRNLPEALGNLDRALKSLPGLEEEQILKQISLRQSKPGAPVCQFDWSNGRPSMVFGGGKSSLNPESWAISISRCADAVEQSH